MSNGKYANLPIKGSITLTTAELVEELERSYAAGVSAGRNTIMKATTTIMDGKGDQVNVDDKAEPAIKEYIARLKTTFSSEKETDDVNVDKS